MFLNNKLCVRLILFILFVFMSGCNATRPTLLQSRSIATPFPKDSAKTCSSLREDLFTLRSDLRNPNIQLVRQRNFILAQLSLQEHARNIRHVSTPREKMGLLITSELLVNEKEIWDFIESVDRLDILGIACRDIEETVSPGFGEGVAHADFRRVGEDFIAYLVFKNNELYLVFAPSSDPVDTYDRKTILSLLGHASQSAVNEGVKAVIP